MHSHWPHLMLERPTHLWSVTIQWLDRFCFSSTYVRGKHITITHSVSVIQNILKVCVLIRRFIRWRVNIFILRRLVRKMQRSRSKKLWRFVAVDKPFENNPKYCALALFHSFTLFYRCERAFGPKNCVLCTNYCATELLNSHLHPYYMNRSILILS